MFKEGQKLVFTRPDGTTEECEYWMRGCVPGCVVVFFLDKNGHPRGGDGLTVPLRGLKKKEEGE